MHNERRLDGASNLFSARWLSVCPHPVVMDPDGWNWLTAKSIPGGGVLTNKMFFAEGDNLECRWSLGGV